MAGDMFKTPMSEPQRLGLNPQLAKKANRPKPYRKPKTLNPTSQQPFQPTTAGTRQLRSRARNLELRNPDVGFRKPGLGFRILGLRVLGILSFRVEGLRLCHTINRIALLVLPHPRGSFLPYHPCLQPSKPPCC